MTESRSLGASPAELAVSELRRSWLASKLPATLDPMWLGLSCHIPSTGNITISPTRKTYDVSGDKNGWKGVAAHMPITGLKGFPPALRPASSSLHPAISSRSRDRCCWQISKFQRRQSGSPASRLFPLSFELHSKEHHYRARCPRLKGQDPETHCPNPRRQRLFEIPCVQKLEITYIHAGPFKH